MACNKLFKHETKLPEMNFEVFYHTEKEDVMSLWVCLVWRVYFPMLG